MPKPVVALPLRVEVDDEDPEVELGEGRTQVHRRSRLSYAALLVGDSQPAREFVSQSGRVRLRSLVGRRRWFPARQLLRSGHPGPRQPPTLSSVTLVLSAPEVSAPDVAVSGLVGETMCRSA